jgi:hypothetical protein
VDIRSELEREYEKKLAEAKIKIQSEHEAAIKAEYDAKIIAEQQQQAKMALRS